jgi:hypothetical protein
MRALIAFAVDFDHMTASTAAIQLLAVLCIDQQDILNCLAQLLDLVLIGWLIQQPSNDETETLLLSGHTCTGHNPLQE